MLAAWATIETGIYLILGYFIFATGVVLFLMFYMRRIFVVVYITEDGFTSKLVQRKLCTVSTNKTVYYMYFRANGVSKNKNFVLISNYPIEFGGSKSNKPIMYRYKLEEHIVLPVNSRTSAYLSFESWIPQS